MVSEVETDASSDETDPPSEVPAQVTNSTYVVELQIRDFRFLTNYYSARTLVTDHAVVHGEKPGYWTVDFP